MKRHGLPDRLRLFYVFSSEAKTITYLYLNDRGTLRKHGAATNPYAIFSDLVSSGKSARTSRPTTSSGSALALSGHKRKRRRAVGEAPKRGGIVRARPDARSFKTVHIES